MSQRAATAMRNRWATEMLRNPNLESLLAVALTIVIGCAQQPAQVEPSNRIERQVLALANGFIKTQGVGWTTPIKIEPGSTSGKFVVTYFTPDEDMELLGPRQLIVTPSTKTVEFVMLD